MSMLETTIEMRCIPREELADYFTKLGGESAENGLYKGSNWEVQIDKQISCTLGRITIPSIKVTFWVEEKYFDEMLSKFRLSFLRGGG